MSLTVIAYANAKKGNEEELRKVLNGLVAPTRAEKGCINYDLHQDLKNPGQFVFYENWTSQEALDAHLQTPHILNGIKAGTLFMTEPVKIVLLKKV